MTDQNKQIAAVESQLRRDADAIALHHLRRLIHQDGRDDLCFHFEDLTVDCTRQPLTQDILQRLLTLAKAKSLADFIRAMFAGKAINLSEDRPVSHCRLRTPDYRQSEVYQKLTHFADNVRANQNIKSIVNLGIGGSDLGPAMVTAGLAGFHDGPVVHYVGNIDPHAMYDILAQCDPRSTLFIMTSKTFTTSETLANAGLAKGWLEQNGVALDTAMVAVTTYQERAVDWGIDLARIFDFDEAVGGRYSLWSAVGLSVMIAVGSRAFDQLLDGAHAMDNHFETAPFASNIPVIMGLLRVWHRSYLGHMAYGIMPYDQRLARLPAWAQQLEMESNGKSVTRHGKPLDQPAGPLIWGEAGVNGQHSFFQWLHQSVDISPIDILIARKPVNLLDDAAWRASHRTLAINAVAQAEALAVGVEQADAPHRHFSGNRPSLMVSWEATTPYALGRLLALYEHITVVSGFVWGVNSFDQWGVELGKKMAHDLASKSDLDGFSPAAKAFLNRLNDEPI
jgi:glucose-6-phosphate isomerase